MLAADRGLAARQSVTAGDQQVVEIGPDERIAFDIPAQPLAMALEAFGSRTGRDIVYNSNLAFGRRSEAVQGFYTPEAALARLLNGTGLAARPMVRGSFVLVPAPPRASAPALDPALRRRYYARIQMSLWKAFCTHAWRGQNRVAARLWIGATGVVERHERVGSTANPDLDREVDTILSGLHFGPPPPGFAQPLAIVIVPQARDVTMGCSPSMQPTSVQPIPTRTGP